MMDKQPMQREKRGGFLRKEDELVTSHLLMGFVKNSLDLIHFLVTTHNTVKIHDPA